MKLAFFWNYLNHHQVCIADALYGLLGEDFVFVTTLPRDERELKGGLDYSSRPYCILAAESPDKHLKALEYARIADVCVFGACSQKYAVERAKQKDCGLAFECGERWLKRGWLNVLSPVLLKWWLNYMRYYRKKPFFKLCSSAFTKVDDEKLGCYINRHYKWGYFTKTNISVNNKDFEVEKQRKIRLMWCARFLKLKHPEVAIKMAKEIKGKGYRFILDFYGSGEEENRMKDLVKKDNLNDVISFHGNRPNEEILKAMQNHDVFLFTSNRLEGWGAVVNEAMANGCVVISADCIGSTAYLIKDGYNGFGYRDKDVSSLTEKVEWLINHPKELELMGRNARNTLDNVWSPQTAAKNLLLLIDAIYKREEPCWIEGPCSKA